MDSLISNSTRSQLEALVTAAQTVRRYAYAPFSHYAVGAALLTSGGVMYTGCNVENSAYPATLCAERNAVAKAISEGVQTFEAIAVVTADGGFPCGMCRQVLFEFAPQLLVIVANADGVVLHQMPLADLLPHGFRFEQASDGPGDHLHDAAS